MDEDAGVQVLLNWEILLALTVLSVKSSKYS